MESLLFIIITAFMPGVLHLIKNFRISNVFPWKVKYVGLVFIIVNVMLSFFLEFNNNENLRFFLCIIGLILILLSKDRRQIVNVSKTELFIFSFVCCTLIYLFSALFINDFTAIVSLPVFVIYMLFLQVFIYHVLLFKSVKNNKYNENK